MEDPTDEDVFEDEQTDFFDSHYMHVIIKCSMQLSNWS